MRRLPNILYRGFSTIDPRIDQQLKSGKLDITRDMGMQLAKQTLKYAHTENTPLSRIAISHLGDSITDIADYIAPLLAKDQSTISELTLDSLKIGDAGLITISEALKDNNSLTFLSLHRNNIGFKGIKSLTDMLCKNKKIKYLAVTGNSFSNSDDPEYDNLISNFAEVIKCNSTLTTFDGRLCFPPSKQEQYEQVLNEALSHNFCLTDIDRNSGFVESPLPRMTNSNVGRLKDVVDDFATILIARIARKIESSDAESYFQEMKNISLNKTARILLKDLTNPEMAKLVDYWHLPLTQHESQKLRHYDGLKWTPLFGQEEISVPDNIANKAGWKIVARTNSRDLTAEGRNLNHCVGGYTYKCFSENSHIVSIVDDTNKSDSTIEFRIKNNEFKMEQHSGFKDSTPSESSKLILKWLEGKLQSGEIRIDYNQLEQDRVARNKITNGLKVKMGFNPRDDEEFNKFIQTFRRKILPTGEKYKVDRFTANFNEFLSEIDLESSDGKYPNKFYAMFSGPNLSDPKDLVTLKSILPKDRDQEDELRKKIIFGIQGSINKICGKEKAVSVSINDDNEVTFSSKNSTALEILKKMFGENIGQAPDGSLLVKNLAALEVRKIATQEAAKIRNDQRENKKITRFSESGVIPATKVTNQSSEALSKNELSLTK